MKKKRPSRKQKKNRTGLYITLLLAGLMILSVFGIVTSPDDPQSYTYGDYTFTYNQQQFQYTTKIEGVSVPFTFLPQDVLHRAIPSEGMQQLRSASLIAVTYDPDDPYATTFGSMQYVLEQEWYDHKGIIVQRGLTNAEGFSLPQVTCADATPENPVLYFMTGNETMFTQEQSCFIMEGFSQTELIQTFDALRYQMYDIIE